LTDITEYGDVMINVYLDEWGNRKINGLTEYGVKIIVTAAGPTLVYVTDAFSLSDTILTHKTFTVSDAIGLADASPLRDKKFTTTDQISIADQAATPTRVLQALDSIGLSENVYVNKTLTITDEIALVEVVEKWVPGALVKTKIFLILGGIAIQLV